MHAPITARCPRWAGRFSFFLLGLIAVLIQTLLVREALFAFHGGEIGLGAFFAVWLAGIAAGAGAGCRALLRARRWAPLGLALLPCCGMAQLALFRIHRLVLPVAAGGYLAAGPYLVLLLVTVAPAGFLTGLLFTLGLRAYNEAPAPAYAIEALGSMVGGTVAALIALPRWPAMVLLTATGPLLIAWGAVYFQRFQRGLILILGLILTVGLVSGSADSLDRVLSRVRWDALATGTRPVVIAETPQHQVVIAEREGEAALYLDGFYQGGLRDPHVDWEIAVLIATQHPAPERLLVCAPGCYGPVLQLAEISGAKLQLAREDPGIDNALARVGFDLTCSADPMPVRDLLRQPDARFDLIAILQGGPLTGSASRFYSREFFARCAAGLRPGGLLALTIPGTANVATEDTDLMRAALFAALTEVFADVRITPGETHVLYAALPHAAPPTESPLTWNPDSLAERAGRCWGGELWWSPAFFAQRFPADRRAHLESAIAQSIAAGTPANTDLRPLVYFEQLRRWDRLAGSQLARLLTALKQSEILTGGGLLAVVLLLAYGAHRRWGRAALCIGSTGLAGMSLSLLLLLLFQTMRGSLYLKVGLFSGLFMAGLAAGGWLGQWMLQRRSAARLLLSSDLLWIAYLTLLAFGLGRLGALPGMLLEMVLLGLSGIAGILTALPFGPAAQLLQSSRHDGAAAGGLADALDHAGAVVGALLTGTLLIPLLGFPGTLLLLIAVKAVSALATASVPRGTGGRTR